MSFDLPVVELVFMALVSGLVTWATIYFSLKQARVQTDRAIADARIRELRPLIKDLADATQRGFEEEDRYFTRDPQWQSSYFAITTSGVEGAYDAGQWAFTYGFIAVALNRDKSLVPPENHAFLDEGPSTYMLRDLGIWLTDPARYGAELREAHQSLDAWVEAGGLKSRNEQDSN